MSFGAIVTILVKTKDSIGLTCRADTNVHDLVSRRTLSLRVLDMKLPQKKLNAFIRSLFLHQNFVANEIK